MNSIVTTFSKWILCNTKFRRVKIRRNLLMNSTQNKAVEKALSKVVTEETASELASLEGEALVNTFNGLCEQMEYQNLMP